MVTRTRVERLTERVTRMRPAGPPAPPTEVWLPDNRRSDDGPGRYPVPGANAVLVIYDPAVESPPAHGAA